jgi:hypothetical protein
MDYQAWCSRTDAELAASDLGEMNLVAAAELPGSQRLDIGLAWRV